MDEVAYSLGVPPDVLQRDNIKWDDGTVKNVFSVVTKEELAKQKRTYKDYLDWMYDSDYFRTDVSFDPVTKAVIEIGCYASEKQRPVAYCTINGIGLGMKEDRVIDHLGPPSRSSIDGVIKRLEFAGFNMEVMLEKREVYYIIVKRISQQK